jgi:hypothetical protein
MGRGKLISKEEQWQSTEVTKNTPGRLLARKEVKMDPREINLVIIC